MLGPRTASGTPREVKVVGSLRRRNVTRPLPQQAAVSARNGGRRVASWKGRSGKTVTVDVVEAPSGALRYRTNSPTWVAKYRRADGVIVERSTGCRDKRAAQAVLNEWERHEEKIRAGVLSPSDAQAAEYAHDSLADHLAALETDQRNAGTTDPHQRETNAKIVRVAEGCGWTRLTDLSARDLSQWLDLREREGMGATTRNRYREALRTFVSWAVRSGRLTQDPIATVPKADQRADRRRERRALTEAELAALIEAAQARPLDEIHRFNRGPKKGQLGATPSARSVEKAKRLGWERALIYRALALTGLRRGELASITLSPDPSPRQA